MTKLYLYLSGKITGNENYRADFSAGREALEAAGFAVCSPVDLGLPEDVSWEAAMRADIREMMLCDGVALLPGWEVSRGACVEERLARDLGLPSKPVSAWIEGAGLTGCTEAPVSGT